MRVALLAVTGTIAGVGLAIFIYGMFRAFRYGLKPKPGQELYAGQMRGNKRMDFLLYQKSSGPPVGVRMSWPQIKGLIQSKEWQRNATSKTFLLMISGAMITVFGSMMFSAVLIDSWGERLYIIGTVTLVFGLIGWNFFKAQPVGGPDPGAEDPDRPGVPP